MNTSQILTILREKIIKEFELDEIDISIHKKAIFTRDIFIQLSINSLNKAVGLLSDNQKQEFELLTKNQITGNNTENLKETFNFFELKNINYVKVFTEEISKMKIAFMTNKRTQKLTELYFENTIKSVQKGLDDKYLVLGEKEDFVEMVIGEIESGLGSKKESEVPEKNRTLQALLAITPTNKSTLKELKKIEKKERLIKILHFIVNNFLVVIVVEFIFYIVSYILFQNKLIDKIPTELESITPEFIKNFCYYLFG
jgi:hypothetical protein